MKCVLVCGFLILWKRSNGFVHAVTFCYLTFITWYFYFCTIVFIYLSFLNKTLVFFVSMCVLFLQSSTFLTQTDHQMFKNICINHIKIEISLIGSNYIFQYNFNFIIFLYAFKTSPNFPSVRPCGLNLTYYIFSVITALVKHVWERITKPNQFLSNLLQFLGLVTV